MAEVRSLKIKTGVVKRYTKEKVSYEKEAATQRAKVAAYEAEGREELFIKQNIACLKESEMMVPDIQRRLAVACEELKGLTNEHSESLAETEEFKQAVQALEEATPHLPA